MKASILMFGIHRLNSSKALESYRSSLDSFDRDTF